MQLQNLLELFQVLQPTGGQPQLRAVKRVSNPMEAYSFIREHFKQQSRSTVKSDQHPPDTSASPSLESNGAETTTAPSSSSSSGGSPVPEEPTVHVLFHCEAELIASAIQLHVNDIYLPRKNFHYLISNVNIDDLSAFNLTEFGGKDGENLIKEKLNIVKFSFLSCRKPKSNQRYRISFI